MRSISFLVSFILFLNISNAQTTIWAEDFESYADGITSTADWTGTCGGCTSGDYFEVRSGAYRAGDVNAFSTWETIPFDISAYSTVSFSLDALEDGDHEGPGCGCGINQDYIDVYYSIDGGPFTVIEDWNGDGEPGHTLTGDSNNGLFTDNDWVSTNVSLGGLSGNTLALRVRMRNTAGSEELSIDNVLIEGTPALPVSWVYFDAEIVDYGTAYLKWAVIQDEHTDKFEIQRAAENGVFVTEYEIKANEKSSLVSYGANIGIEDKKDNFFRIVQYDKDGTSNFSEVRKIKAIKESTFFNLYPTVFKEKLIYEASKKSNIEIYNTNGVFIKSLEISASSQDISSSFKDLNSGVYLLKIQSSEAVFTQRVIKK